MDTRLTSSSLGQPDEEPDEESEIKQILKPKTPLTKPGHEREETASPSPRCNSPWPNMQSSVQFARISELDALERTANAAAFSAMEIG